MAVISAVLFTDLQAAAPGPTADDAAALIYFGAGIGISLVKAANRPPHEGREKHSESQKRRYPSSC
jgi:hypothetical protein